MGTYELEVLCTDVTGYRKIMDEWRSKMAATSKTNDFLNSLTDEQKKVIQDAADKLDASIGLAPGTSKDVILDVLSRNGKDAPLEVVREASMSAVEDWGLE